MAADPFEQGGKFTLIAAQFGQRRKLRLPARPPVIDHHVLRHPLRQRIAQILRDQRQRQIDPGRNPRRGPDMPIADMDAVGINLDRRKQPRQQFRPAPVGGGPPPVEQPRPGQQKCPRTHAAQAPHIPGSRAQEIGVGRLAHGIAAAIAAHHDQRVERARALGRHRIERDARRTAHRPARRRNRHQPIGPARHATRDFKAGDRAAGVKELKVGIKIDADTLRHGIK